MKRLLGYIILFIAIVLYAISCSNTLSEQYTDARYNGPLIFSYDKFRYGDLYGISFLPGYKFEMAKEPSYVKKLKYNIPPVIDLYMINDSYLGFHLATDTNFYGIRKLVNKEWFDTNKMETALDTNKINVLLFEATERYFRYVADSFYLKSQVQVYKDPDLLKNKTRKEKEKKPGVWSDVFSYIFNAQTNINLEFNAFDYHFITPLRELKAQLNYKLFNRISKEVVVSNHNNHLYLAETIDTSHNLSSFNPLPDEEVKKIVACLNATYKYYKAMGFDEVYFTIVPNPVSVLCPDQGKYNHLIPRVTQDSSLQMPVIELFDIYMKTPTPVYYQSDTHWNYDGFTIWLNEFHKRMNSLVQQKSRPQFDLVKSNK
jgi:hypothetical protein